MRHLYGNSSISNLDGCCTNVKNVFGEHNTTYRRPLADLKVFKRFICRDIDSDAVFQALQTDELRLNYVHDFKKGYSIRVCMYTTTPSGF